MAISLSRYVNIISGVGGNAPVATRALIGRLFTDNPLLPPQSYLEFASANAVGLYFGFTSSEYLRALFYFGWISKNITQPTLLSFARWVSTAVGSQIHGAPSANYSVSSFSSITTGDFTLTLGGFTSHLTGISFSGAASLATVAAAVQAKINAFSAGGAAWTAATVVYNSTRGSFDFTSGIVGTDTISIVAGTTTDVAGLLGWLTGATVANGSAVESITQCLTTSSGQSNNFGSFEFMPVTPLTLSQVVEAATWNKALTPNVQFMYCWHVSKANAATWSAALIGIGGNTGTLDSPVASEYPAMVPMMIMAATNYTSRNSGQNYMFQIFNLTPSVTNDADANTYDALRINYYGQTQTAGQLLQFYQRGVMMGLPTDPIDQNTYANEIWLKDAISAAILNLLLSLAQVSANAGGRAQVMSIIQSIVNSALFNSVISVGKALNTTQQLYITNATGDPMTWIQVQNTGYWFTAVIQSYVANGITQYKVVYTLIYSKDDVIRLVQGTDILI